MTTIELLQAILMYGVVPLWAAAGTADYLCHRASRIEATSGPKESMMHLLELIEAGGPLLAVLFLEVNAFVLLFMALGLVVHQATAVWDVRYANRTREVSPTEQHVHGVMEMLPLMAAVLVAVIHWPAPLALLGHGAASYAIELKRPPLPGWYLAGVLATAAGVGLLYVEELARTLHAGAGAGGSRDTGARRGPGYERKQPAPGYGIQQTEAHSPGPERAAPRGATIIGTGAASVCPSRRLR